MNLDTGLVAPRKRMSGEVAMEWHCAIIGLLAGKRAASRHRSAWITGIGMKI